MIYVGIDDTDMPGTPGTNQCCRALAARLDGSYRCRLIVRHQLLLDDRVPYTSHNSAASLQLEPVVRASLDELRREVRNFLSARFLPGSDPGYCVASHVPQAVVEFGRRSQTELVTQDEARGLATAHHLHLEGCGGTNDGVIGALAAVGLAARGNDGRVVRIGTWADDLSGRQLISTLRERHVVVRCLDTGRSITRGTVDVGKHLRPNYRADRIVLYARRCSDHGGLAEWQAVRLT